MQWWTLVWRLSRMQEYNENCSGQWGTQRLDYHMRKIVQKECSGEHGGDRNDQENL